MKKLILLSTILTAFILSFSFLPVFAADDNSMMDNAGDAIGNVANGAKNVVEGAIAGTGNLITKGGEGISNMTEDMTNSNNRAADESTSNNDRTSNTNYTATRTSTDSPATIAGMTATTWTWLIIAILGAAIIGMVWFYSKQYDNQNSSTNHIDE